MIKKEVDIEKVEELLQMATVDFCEYGAPDSARNDYLARWREDIGYSLKDLNKE